MSREKFYSTQLNNFIKDKNSKIIVLGAGNLDMKVFKDLNFNNVTFTNLENSTENKIDFNQNIHDLRINDGKFDYCVAHACVHHSSRPHQAILELYRVSSKGILVIEARDTLLSRIACKLNLSEEYELSAVKKNKNTGGVDNTNIPNYVYRWTEREIIKLIKSYKPEINHKITFEYGHQLKFSDSFFINLIFKLFFFIFKKQQNLFSIFIEKDKNNLKFHNWYKK